MNKILNLLIVSNISHSKINTIGLKTAYMATNTDLILIKKINAKSTNKYFL